MKTIQVNKQTNATELVPLRVTQQKEVSSQVKSLNKVVLTGIIGNEPVHAELKNGRKKTYCMLGTNSVYLNNNGERIKNTLWHSIVGWGDWADKLKNEIHVGDKISVSGRINVRKYKDNSGVQKIYTEVVVLNLEKQESSINEKN